MAWPRLRTLLGSAVVLGVAAAVSWPLYYILGPAIDNRLKIGTGRDLDILKSYPIGEVTLGELVASTYSVGSWHAYHEGLIFATRVDCRVFDSGGKPLLLSWEIRHRVPPREWVEERDLYITPLTRWAGKLTPELLPAGVSPQDLSHVGDQSSGVVYDIARRRTGY